MRIVRVRRVQYSAVPCHASLARIALCLYSSTLFDRVPRFCVGPRLVAILLNTYGEEIFLSPSAITVSWPASTTSDPSIALDSAHIYNDADSTNMCHS